MTDAPDAPRTCITHHRACDCREAAHAAEIARLQATIAAAVVRLNEAPDVSASEATRRDCAATQSANLEAWAILTFGQHPPSRRASLPQPDANPHPGATPCASPSP